MNEEKREIIKKLEVGTTFSGVDVICRQYKEIERLNKDLKDACEVIERLKEDKKKAIEYIEEHKQKGYRTPITNYYDFWNELNDNEIKELLEILSNGSESNGSI